MKSNNPKISIIVPIYNAQTCLYDCIDSIINQSFYDWELLLVNDGSTDNSLSICEEYARQDSRIRIFNKINGGVSSARNIGLQNVKSDNILFVDSDDMLPLDALSSLYCDTELDLVIGGVQSSDNCWTLSSYPVVYQDIALADFLCEYLGKHLLFKSVWSKLYKSEIIKKYDIRFDENLSLGEDTVFLTEYVNYVKTILVVPTICYTYNFDDTYLYACKYSKKGFKPLYDFYVKQNSIYKKIGKTFDIDNIYLKPDFVFDVAREILKNPDTDDTIYIYRFFSLPEVLKELNARESNHIDFIVTLVKRGSFTLLKRYLKFIDFIKRVR